MRIERKWIFSNTKWVQCVCVWACVWACVCMFWDYTFETKCIDKKTTATTIIPWQWKWHIHRFQTVEMITVLFSFVLLYNFISIQKRSNIYHFDWFFHLLVNRNNLSLLLQWFNSGFFFEVLIFIWLSWRSFFLLLTQESCLRFGRWQTSTLWNTINTM